MLLYQFLVKHYIQYNVIDIVPPIAKGSGSNNSWKYFFSLGGQILQYFTYYVIVVLVLDVYGDWGLSL